MAAQTGRDDADKDRVRVRDTNPGDGGFCDYGVDRFPEELAFGGGAHDSVEASCTVGPVGTRRRRVDAGLRGLPAQCPDDLQDGDSVQDDEGDGDQRTAGLAVLVWAVSAAVWGGMVLRNAGVRRRADTGMDRHAEGVLPGCAVYWTGRNGRLGWTGCDFEVGLPAFAWGAGGGGSEFRREPGRRVAGGSNCGVVCAQRTDFDSANRHNRRVYREHDSAEVVACFSFRACGAGTGGNWGQLARPDGRGQKDDHRSGVDCGYRRWGAIRYSV